MLNRFISCLLVIIITQLTLGCGSTTLFMKDGQQLEGMVVSSDAEQIKLKSEKTGDLVMVERGKVQEVEYAGASAASTGMGLTISGVLLFGTGFTVMAGSGGGGWSGLEALLIGFLTFVVGAPLTLTGIPLWIAGASKRNDQRKLYEFDTQTGMFNTPTQTGTYKLTLRF